MSNTYTKESPSSGINASNRKISLVRKVLISFLVIFLALQFIRPLRNNGNAESPVDISHFLQVPDSVMAIFKTSCYDCHSNHTNYPWYVNINPVGFWMRSHINDGKRALNFSDLSSFTPKKLDHRLNDIAEQVEEREMPLSSYTLIHRQAKLDAKQIEMIKAWTVDARKQVGFNRNF